ncbi:MAG: Na+/H+ antiporter subunit E [Phycisphaerae bacterium]|nr:Na+/H+ antiporter subunit E [Phycisphaerae bacterium]
MIAFIWIIMLSLMWAAMTEEFTLSNLLIGFVLAYVILLTSSAVVGSGGFITKFPRFIKLMLYFLKDLVISNLRVAYDILTPTYHMRPGIIAVPLDASTDLEITTLSNLITLTPGTLSLDISSDRKVLYIYTMFVEDRDAIVREIKNGMERRVLEVLR